VSTGTASKQMREAKDTLRTTADRVALVLIDTWNQEDPPEGQPLPETLANIRRMLLLARRHGIAVIHAPSHGVAVRYPRYKAIRQETEAFVAANPRRPYLMWPPPSNEEFVWAENARKVRLATRQSAPTVRAGEPDPYDNFDTSTLGTCPGLPFPEPSAPSSASLPPPGTLDISRYLTPAASEYVVASHDEMRYVLYRHGVTVLVYVGGALNECMMQRATGLNLIVGVDPPYRSGFTAVVLGDASAAMASPAIDAAAFKAAMLDYLRFKMAFVSDSGWLRFQPASPAAAPPAH
jgi:nicotinamidase-related amidase